MNAELRRDRAPFQRYKDLEPTKQTETRGFGTATGGADPRGVAQSGGVMQAARPPSPGPRAIGRLLPPPFRDRLSLFASGAAAGIAALERGLSEEGVQLTDIHHLLLSHIHLDHAGAAGVLVREHPTLQVHVSEIGAPHLIAPERLERSARRLYGDSFDTLWGELAPVPQENVHVVGEHVLGLDCFPTPGHASHHVSYLDRDGTLYAGDAAGVRIQPGRAVLPPTPPPEFDLDLWQQTLEEIERRDPDRLALIHFGVVEDRPHLS